MMAAGASVGGGMREFARSEERSELRAGEMAGTRFLMTDKVEMPYRIAIILSSTLSRLNPLHPSVCLLFIPANNSDFAKSIKLV